MEGSVSFILMTSTLIPAEKRRFGEMLYKGVETGQEELKGQKNTAGCSFPATFTPIVALVFLFHRADPFLSTPQ